MCAAIERETMDSDLRGKSFINLRNIPNGHYTIYYLRIGQPLTLNSRLKVLGKAQSILVNINRSKLKEEDTPRFGMKVNELKPIQKNNRVYQ
jgi:hypothetical protein